MGKFDWMEWFGWPSSPAEHREATDCPCPPCRTRKAHRAGWTAIGRAFRAIAYWRFAHWQAREERGDWPDLATAPREAGVDKRN